MRNFRKYNIWIESMNLVQKMYAFLNSLPNEEKYGLRSQMSGSAVSIPSNIAEGSSRNSDSEFKRFLEIAIGSSFELETQFLLCIRLKIGETNDTDLIITDLHRLQKQINALIQKLTAKS